METLRNGVPLDVQHDRYEFYYARPQRVGDQTVIVTESRGMVEVILLRGIGRKRWLVECETLRKYLKADARAKIHAAIAASREKTL